MILKTITAKTDITQFSTNIFLEHLTLDLFDYDIWYSPSEGRSGSNALGLICKTVECSPLLRRISLRIRWTTIEPLLACTSKESWIPEFATILSRKEPIRVRFISQESEQPLSREVENLILANFDVYRISDWLQFGTTTLLPYTTRYRPGIPHCKSCAMMCSDEIGC